MSRLTDIRSPGGGHWRDHEPPRHRDSFWKQLLRALLAPFRWLFKWPTAVIIYFLNLVQKLLLRGVGLLRRSIPKNWLAFWIILLLVLILLIQAFSSINFPRVDKNKFQAVFLNNGQIVYFGHLKDLNNGYVALTDVYYLQATKDGKTPANLVKLGSELYGPENEIFIPKEQITFWENLKEDSQVAQAVRSLSQ